MTVVRALNRCTRACYSAATMLVRAVEDVARSMDAGRYSRPQVICLHVLATNESAQRLYEKISFRRALLLPNFYSFDGATHAAYSYALWLHPTLPRTGLAAIAQILASIRTAALATGAFVVRLLFAAAVAASFAGIRLTDRCAVCTLHRHEALWRLGQLMAASISRMPTLHSSNASSEEPE